MTEASEREERACGQCKYVELQCPPVIRCRLKNIYRYLDDPACPDFEPAE